VIYAQAFAPEAIGREGHRRRRRHDHLRHGRPEAPPGPGRDPGRRGHDDAALSEFGLTPASRSKVKAKVEGPKDALGEFLNRRKKV
jgi:hypothetical protein